MTSRTASLPRDFAIPISPSLAGRPIQDDWYGVHVRIGETLGSRVLDGVTRYLWCDDPGLPAAGRAIRIRALTNDVSAILTDEGIPEVELDLEVPRAFAFCASRKVDPKTPADRILDDDLMIHRYAERAGLADISVPPTMPRIRNYKIDRKGAKFSVTALHACFRANVEDPDRLIAAMTSGIGRDKGLGFGIITPIGEVF